MDEDNSSWVEYKKLVIRELERNDFNIQKVLSAVQDVGKNIVSIENNLETIKEDVKRTSDIRREMEKRLLELEKDFSSLKTRVIMIGGIVGTIVSVGVSVLIKSLS